MAEHLAKGLDVCFCATVTKIEYGGHGVTITASNGQVYKADAAICTVSLGVLKVGYIAASLARDCSNQRQCALSVQAVALTSDLCDS